ncbi:MAG: folate-binding protein YgfZ [Magnetococcales bacterium]|nr:folate-binding protein YgfZ [Magnetococcales bacterium]
MGGRRTAPPRPPHPFFLIIIKGVRGGLFPPGGFWGTTPGGRNPPPFGLPPPCSAKGVFAGEPFFPPRPPPPPDCGNHDAEFHTLLEGAAWVDFGQPGLVTLSGPDHLEFFGGLTTNQVRHVSTTRTLYSALLTPQGRYLYDFTMAKTATAPDRLLLVTESDDVSALIRQITFYRLRAPVQINNDQTRCHLLGLIGPAAGLAIGRLFPGLAWADAALGATFTPEPDLHLWRDPRHAGFGWRLLIPEAQWSSMSTRLTVALPPAGWTAWEACRIHHALPRGGQELIPQETLPLEAGLLEMNGVDFGKGCYVGQETTARTQHRGTIKKRLFQITGLPGAGALGATVQRPDGKEVGSITSHCPQTGAALAMLRLSDVEDAPESLQVQGKPVTVHKPSWAQWSGCPELSSTQPVS